uniref:Uncharacterized protein n=1 Tax=Solanum tuberosum TaxID=4113 RepID=M1B4R6_SOLTU
MECGYSKRQLEKRKKAPNRSLWTLDLGFLDSGISSLRAQSVKRRRFKENGNLEGTDRNINNG